MIDTLDFMWRGGNVMRYHTHPTLRPDYVGHHSYNGACIIMVLRPGRDDLVVAFLKHDMAEWKFGDMPAPAKRAMPPYPNVNILGEAHDSTSFRDIFGKLEEVAMAEAGIITPEFSPADAWVLKLADAMDGMRFCTQERRMGNAGIAECYYNFENYTGELIYGNPPIGHVEQIDVDLFDYLKGEWHHVHSK